MAENETTETTEETTEAVEANAETTEETTTAEAVEATAEEEEDEEISYHAVEKEGEITAIWEMQGRKHIRTISPRSGEGQKILDLFTSELHETDSPPLSATAE